HLSDWQYCCGKRLFAACSDPCHPRPATDDLRSESRCGCDGTKTSRIASASHIACRHFGKSGTSYRPKRSVCGSSTCCIPGKLLPGSQWTVRYPHRHQSSNTL